MITFYLCDFIEKFSLACPRLALLFYYSRILRHHNRFFKRNRDCVYSMVSRIASNFILCNFGIASYYLLLTLRMCINVYELL